MYKAVVAVAAAAFLALAGCSTASPPDTSAAPQDTVVQQLGFAGKSAQEIVQAIDSSDTARPLGFGASVRGSQLVLSTDGEETSLDLPPDLFYLSIAPYRTRTHECYHHSLASCQGELANEALTVTIVDDQGKVLLDERTKTHANGFVGFWLPRDVAGTVTVTHDGLKGSVPFTTIDGSPTCMTTLRLTDRA